MSAVSSAHWEGFEAADPATPAAVLRFDSAVTRYAALDAGPLPWRTLFQGDDEAPGDHAHMGHAGAAESSPVTTQE